MGWPVWLRYGVIGGVLAFAVTLGANLAILLVLPGDLCRAGPVILIPLFVGSFLVFVLLAGGAGFASARRGAPMDQASLAGLVVGAISGCALVILPLFSTSMTQRLQQLSTTCPAGGEVTFFGSAPPGFALLTPPPGFLVPTPPPGFVVPTPPPGFVFPAPPPGAFGGSFGVPGTIGGLIGAVIAIGIGIAIAYGAAALGAVIASATRPRPV